MPPAMFKSDAMGWAVLAAPKRTSVHQSTSVRMTKYPQGVRYALQKVSPLGHRKSADDLETADPSAPLPPRPQPSHPQAIAVMTIRPLHRNIPAGARSVVGVTRRRRR